MKGSRASELRVMLYPTNYSRSRQFYLDTMAWTLKHEWDHSDSKGVMFDTGCATIELLWPEDFESNPGKCNLSFRVTDVWSLWSDMSKKAPVVFALRQNTWGDDSFCVSDPDGNKLTFFTDRKSEESLT
jgi:uncharacterized glyoxalase superfamily protein PhnB